MRDGRFPKEIILETSVGVYQESGCFGGVEWEKVQDIHKLGRQRLVGVF